jgi:hypothetical protein
MLISVHLRSDVPMATGEENCKAIALGPYEEEHSLKSN